MPRHRKLLERHIMAERGRYWVLDTGTSYAVMKNVGTGSESNLEYTRDADGLSIAVAYIEYLHKRETRKNNVT